MRGTTGGRLMEQLGEGKSAKRNKIPNARGDRIFGQKRACSKEKSLRQKRERAAVNEGGKLMLCKKRLGVGHAETKDSGTLPVRNEK